LQKKKKGGGELQRTKEREVAEEAAENSAERKNVKKNDSRGGKRNRQGFAKVENQLIW